jgi:arginase family enzyme
MSAAVTVLRGRTSDRSADNRLGAEALGEELAARLGVPVVAVGEPGAPRDGRWEADLRDGREAIAEAGVALSAALDAGAFPILLASDCTVCMGSLPVLAAREPSTRVVWLDAHGDFNTPATTASGFLGGMCLSAACGRWDGGFGAGLDPRRVVFSDGRDLDAAERDEMEAAGLAITPPGSVAAAVRGERVFLHLDFDILDPSEMPFSFPASGGLSAAELAGVLRDLGDGAASIAGLQLTSVAAPHSARRLADALAPVLPG